MPPAAGYSGTPLPQKLGFKPGHRVLLVQAPESFGTTHLGPLPDVELHRRAGRLPYDMVLLFTTSRRDLERRVDGLRGRLTVAGAIWIVWPKRSSGVPTDLTEDVLREVLLPTGLVDTKVCAVDDIWSGLRFVVRLRHR